MELSRCKPTWCYAVTLLIMTNRTAALKQRSTMRERLGISTADIPSAPSASSTSDRDASTRTSRGGAKQEKEKVTPTFFFLIPKRLLSFLSLFLFLSPSFSGLLSLSPFFYRATSLQISLETNFSKRPLSRDTA